jgi:hypothetical protein
VQQIDDRALLRVRERSILFARSALRAWLALAPFLR